jgi:hypothetical protein
LPGTVSLVSRGHFTDDRGAKKTPLARGCRSLACVEERLLVVIPSPGVRRIALVPDPAFLVTVALARLLPKGAAVPLMPGYEQHPCQRAKALKRCDMLQPAGCTNVTRCTLPARFFALKGIAPAVRSNLQSPPGRRKCQDTRRFLRNVLLGKEAA